MVLKYRHVHWVFLLVCLFIFSSVSICFGAPINANTDEKTVFETEPITDLDILYDHAKNGISDKIENMNTKAVLQKIGSNKLSEIDIVQTTQCIKITEDDKGQKQTSYATTIFASIPNLPSLRESYDEYDDDEDEDSTYSVRAYSIIYWNEYEDQAQLLYGNLEKVTGGWQILDSRVYLSNRHVINGQTGWTMNNGWKEYQQNNYPSSLTYSYTTPSSWLPVKFNPSAPQMDLGSTSNVTITFGSDSWNFQFTNNYDD